MSETPEETSEATTNELLQMKLDAALKQIKDMERALECIICTNILTPPIKVCPTGHAFCHSCELKECPFCKQCFNGGRGYHLEAVVELLFAKCNNKGCVTTLRSIDIPEHEINCRYRPIICGCEEKVNLMDCISHLEEKHDLRARALIGRNRVPTCLVSYEISNSELSELKDAKEIIFHDRTPLTYNGHSYLVQTFFKENDFYVFVQQMYPPYQEKESGAGITVTVEITKTFDMDEVTSSYIIPVQCLRKSELEIMESGKVAVFPAAFLKNVWTGSTKNEWTVRYTINFGKSTGPGPR